MSEEVMNADKLAYFTDDDSADGGPDGSACLSPASK